jgi:hypothetical protein
MRRRIGCWLLGWALVMGLAGAAESLLPNGGLEQAGADGQWPQGWPRAKEGVTWEQEEGGNHFLRFRATAPDQMVMLYLPVLLPAEVRALEVSCRVRCTDLKPGKSPWFDARVIGNFRDRQGQQIGSMPPPFWRKATTGWVERQVRFLVPEGAELLELMPALFRVQAGTFDLDDLSVTPTDPAIVAAEAEARAKANWRPAEPPAEAARPERWPKPVKVAGRQLLDPAGQEVWLQGVNVVSLEWNWRGESVLAATLTALEQWSANTIRLPVKDEYWFGRAGDQTDGGTAYRELVDRAVLLAANRGAYLVLDLHRFHAPKAEHVEFWRDAAARYANHPAVLFDLFNEPHGVSWEVWRNGGWVGPKPATADENAFTAPDPAQPQGFQSPGMQALVDAARSTGARNVVIAGGLDWAYDLSGVVDGYALTDERGDGIMYASHIYPWKRDWPGKVLRAAERYPIFVGEVGADIHKMDFIPLSAQEDPDTWVPDMLGLIQRHRLHWTGFSFHPRATPVMIQDWHFTPTEFWGVPAKAALAGQPFTLRRLR